MIKKVHILLVEDDVSLAFLTKDHLEQEGYIVTHVDDGQKAWKEFLNGSFDLCVVDVMLPALDGFEVVKKIRELNEQIPVLFLSAKSLQEDRLTGLRVGADDYITKPFSMEEFLLRIKVFLKRSGLNYEQFGEETFGDYTFDFSGKRLFYKDEPIGLTQREAELLAFLLMNKGKLIERRLILEKIWGKNDYFLGRSLDVFISKLRKKFSRDQRVQIVNVHGVGFRIELVEKKASERSEA
ncbi:MAG: response regulator transcription factor [Cytophagales bacterium]|nr:response regulator transcription factor [Cytophagales bacterium]